MAHARLYLVVDSVELGEHDAVYTGLLARRKVSC